MQRGEDEDLHRRAGQARVEDLAVERARLDALAGALLEKVSFNQEEAYEIAGVPQTPLDPEEEAKAAAAP